MSQWTHLREIPSMPWLPKKLQADIAATNVQIVEILAKRQQLDERAAKIRAGDEPMSIMQIGNDFGYERISLLEQEERCRNDVAPLEAILHEAAEKAFQHAGEEHQRELTRIYVGLLELGWPRNFQLERSLLSEAVPAAEKITQQFAADGSQVGRITPGMLMSHPRIFELAGEITAKRPPIGAYAQWFANNRQAIDQLSDEFGRLRNQALAAAGV